MLSQVASAALLLVLVLSLGCPAAQCNGPDPRAYQIEFSLVSSTSPPYGRIEIKGTADNYGTEEFVSGEGQQSLQLYEGSTLVSEQPFQNLALDETVEVTYERDWSLSSEFLPSSYQIVIAYDPDILMDGNEDNDDCNTNNNTLTRSTSGIASELFGAR